MSDEYDETTDDGSGDNDSDGIKNLRRQHKQAAAELKTAQDELAKYRAAERVQTVAEVLKAKGLPDKVATLYQGSDVSEDAIVKWAEQYADVFGKSSTEGQSSQSGVNESNSQSAGRVNDASEGNVHPTQNPKGPSGRILGSPDEIQHALETWKYEDLVKAGYMPQDDGTLFARSR
jgi:hypothetical protein